MLTDSLCAYLKERDYLVGVSLDGPRHLHDANRIFANGQGSFGRVRQGIGLLRKHGVLFNILAVMTRQTAGYISKLRMFFDNYDLGYRLKTAKPKMLYMSEILDCLYEIMVP